MYCLSIAELIVNDPIFSKEDFPFLSPEEAYERSVQKSTRYVRIRKKYDFDFFDEIFARR